MTQTGCQFLRELCLHDASLFLDDKSDIIDHDNLPGLATNGPRTDVNHDNLFCRLTFYLFVFVFLNNANCLNRLADSQEETSTEVSMLHQQPFDACHLNLV